MKALALGALLLVVIAVANAFEIGGDVPSALAASALCVPGSAAAVYLLSRLMGARWPLLFVAFAWGALVAGPVAGALNDALGSWSLGALEPGPALSWFGAGEAAVVEELLKVAVVAAIILWRRPRGLEGWIQTILLGAASGIGFNVSESSVILANDLAGSDYVSLGGNWFIRQFIGALPGHPAYTALAAAGLGAVLLVSRRRVGAALAWCGLAAGMAAHYVWDAWGAALPAPDGLLGFAVTAAETLLVDGVSFAVVLTILLSVVDARRRHPELTPNSSDLGPAQPAGPYP